MCAETVMGWGGLCMPDKQLIECTDHGVLCRGADIQGHHVSLLPGPSAMHMTVGLCSCQ